MGKNRIAISISKEELEELERVIELQWSGAEMSRATGLLSLLKLGARKISEDWE